MHCPVKVDFFKVLINSLCMDYLNFPANFHETHLNPRHRVASEYQIHFEIVEMIGHWLG